MVYFYVLGNDTAVALAEHISGSVPDFAILMNKKAEELKLEDTNFVTPHGLDEDEHYTTSYELARITDYALNNKEFVKIVKTQDYTVNINGNQKNIRNTNELLGYLDGVYGVKTGFTNGANRCLVTSVKRDNMDIISIVLGADTKKDRTKDSIEIIEYVFKNYQMVDLKYMINEKFDGLVEEVNFNIEKGINNNLMLDLEENDINLYPINKEKLKDISIEVEIKEDLISPVNKGDRVGKMCVLIGEDTIYKLDILAKNDIRKKGIWDYFEEVGYKFLENNFEKIIEKSA